MRSVVANAMKPIPEGIIHFASLRSRCSGAVQIAFWSRRMFLKNSCSSDGVGEGLGAGDCACTTAAHAANVTSERSMPKRHCDRLILRMVFSPSLRLNTDYSTRTRRLNKNQSAQQEQVGSTRTS